MSRVQLNTPRTVQINEERIVEIHINPINRTVLLAVETGYEVNRVWTPTEQRRELFSYEDIEAISPSVITDLDALSGGLVGFLQGLSKMGAGTPIAVDVRAEVINGERK